MNGAEALVRMLMAAGIKQCFANPGTSEMHFLAALDRIGGITCSLALFEGVVTGAADGYQRLAERPACTLLHCGPGLANGLANLHNAKRARSGIINIVGDHATDHVRYDTPLTSDTEAVARPFSDWVKRVSRPEDLVPDTLAAIVASREATGGISTLILPADIAWSPSSLPADLPGLPPRRAEPVDATTLSDLADIIADGSPTLLYVTGSGLFGPGIRALGRLQALPHVEALCPINIPRAERGAGLPVLERMPYAADAARQRIGHVERVVLVETELPASFFGYPGKPGTLAPDTAEIITLAAPGQDGGSALAALADLLNAPSAVPAARYMRELPSGPITPEAVGISVARTLPENAVVVEEALTAGGGLFADLATAAPHDHIQITGGSIGNGPPLALGASVACPDRRVVAVQTDGSALYTLQALWSLAREGSDATVLLLDNGGYRILKGEMSNVGIKDPGAVAHDLTTIDRPALDWVALARGFGVVAERVEDTTALESALLRANSTPGPSLIAARILQ